MARLLFGIQSILFNRVVFNNGLPQLTQSSGMKQKVSEKLKELKIPLKPKKPLSPYFKFVQDQRESIMRQHPDWKVTQVTIQCAADWKKIDPTVKSKYEKEFKEEMEHYAQQYLQYTKNLTQEQKEALDEYNKELKKAKAVREKRKKIRENEKPKRPIGAYMLYVLDQAKEQPNKTVVQLMGSLKDEWANLPEGEKAKYVESVNKAKEEYEFQLKRWELKMIDAGNLDIVRQSTLMAKQPPKPKKLK